MSKVSCHMRSGMTGETRKSVLVKLQQNRGFFLTLSINDQVLGQDKQLRIKGLPRPSHFEVKVRARASSGVPHEANEVASFNILACFYFKRIQVSIDRFQT